MLVRSPRTLATLTAPLALCAGVAQAQTITPLVQEGDAVAGVGNVTRIDNLTVNAAGTWLVEVDTDNADSSIDGALLRDGALYLQEGQALTAPTGASIGSFDAVTLNEAGVSGWNLFLDGTSGTSDDSGIYRDTTLVLQEGTLSGAPGFSAGTPYIGFFETKINDSGQILVMASVDDPAIATTVDRGLVIFAVDASGTLLSETVIVKEGDVLPGQTEQVDDLETGPHAFAFNDAGDALYIADLSGDAAADHALYLNTTLLAQEGSASPVAGRSWSTLSSGEVDLNDAGDWVLGAALDGDAATASVLVKNGAVVVQEGDTLDAVAPDTLTGFGSGPVQLTAYGNVLWYGDLSGDASMDESLWLDDVLLARTGVTTINGLTLTDIAGIQDGYAVSSNGRFVLFEGTLSDGTEGVFQVTLGPGVATVRNGSGTNRLCYASTDVPNLGTDWDATVDATGHSGAIGTGIVAYDQSLAGVGTPYGELLVLVEPLGGVQLASSLVFGTGVNTHVVPLPADASAAGVTVATQALIFGGGVELCNAIDVELGF